MTTITIDRELLEQALAALTYQGTMWSTRRQRRMAAVDALRAALEAPSTAPAWHGAPTCDGLWLCDEGDENPYRFTCHKILMPLSPYLSGEGERWYGPIPPDGDKP